MVDKCDLCLLELIFLSSHLTGIGGVDDAHVFITSGENVQLSCNNALRDCKSTTWLYNSFSNSSTVELIGLGMKKKDTERHERLNLGSDCSLNIKNITNEDYGSYFCQQWTGVNRDQKQGTDARVYLHVLHVSSSSSSSSQTEISADSVTLSCQLYSYAGVSCKDSVNSEGIELIWVNQAGDKIKTDPRYQISAPGHCIITLTTTLLNEDHNREWRCNVTHRDQVKTSATYTAKSSVQAKTTAAVIPVHVTNSQHPSTASTHKTKVTVISVSAAVFAAFLVAVLWMICRKSADNKRGTDESVVKDEDEYKGTYETINMSIPPTARDNEQIDDVTYCEVSSSKKPVKSLSDHNDTVTYAAIRGTEKSRGMSFTPL